MQSITCFEIYKIEQSSNPRDEFNSLIFKKYAELGYERTHNWVEQSLDLSKIHNFETTRSHLEIKAFEILKFKLHKDLLIKIILKLNHKEIESWAIELRKEGYPKQLIYKIILELFRYIEYHSKTKGQDCYYDFLADFADRFTAWGKSFRIFPDEPDCFS